MTFPVPTFVRLEFLTPTGWVDNGTAALLYPHRYPERLREKGKFGRCTALDEKLKPTGRVWVSDDVPPDPSVLVRTDNGRIPWALPEPARLCLLCSSKHSSPFDGSCLL